MTRVRPKQYDTYIRVSMTKREKIKLEREADKRGTSVAELIRSWVHKLPALEDEVDPI